MHDRFRYNIDTLQIGTLYLYFDTIDLCNTKYIRFPYSKADQTRTNSNCIDIACYIAANKKYRVKDTEERNVYTRSYIVVKYCDS